MLKKFQIIILSKLITNDTQQCLQLFFRANTIHYAILVETTCVCITLTSLLTDFRKRTLTFRAWLPYDYSLPFLYYITYAHQLISLIIGSVLHVACDGLICGLLVHICCQIKILESRLRRIAREPDILHDCILQHNRIFEFVYIFIYIIINITRKLLSLR